MGIKHSVTKSSGQAGYAIEWNAEHIFDSNVNISPYRFSGGEPVNSSDYATKNYVDLSIAGISISGSAVTARSIFTVSTDYVVNTSWAKIYAFGTAYALKIENPSGSGESIRYWYSKNLGTPVEGTLSPGQSVNISDLNTGSIDIRVSRYAEVSDAYHITFYGIGMANGWIRGHVIFDQ